MSIFDKFGFASTQKQTANVPNYKLSPIASRSGIVFDSILSVNNKDVSFGEVMTSIRVGIGGDLVAQGPAGDVLFYPGLLDGQTVYGKYIAVLSTGLMNSNGTTSTTPGTTPSITVTTTCDQIAWFGGET